MPALARKSSSHATKPARSSTAPANVAERQGDREQGSIRHLVATDGPQLEPTPASLLTCLKEGKQGFWLDIENPGDADYHLLDRKSTRLNSSHRCISYAVFCLKKKKSSI